MVKKITQKELLATYAKRTKEAERIAEVAETVAKSALAGWERSLVRSKRKQLLTILFHILFFLTGMMDGIIYFAL